MGTAAIVEFVFNECNLAFRKKYKSFSCDIPCTCTKQLARNHWLIYQTILRITKDKKCHEFLDIDKKRIQGWKRYELTIIEQNLITEIENKYYK